MNKNLEKSFTDEILKNRGIIHKVCSVYTNTVMDREDLFQEILLNAWKSYPKFEYRSKFSTWLYRIALNTALMRLRAKAKTKNVSFVDTIEAENVAHNESGSNDDIKQLYAAIGRLDNIEKSIILLYLDDLSYKEISEIIGITENHVGVKINRIKSKLKEILNHI